MTCYSCSSNTKEVFNFGSIPFVNSFFDSHEINKEKKVPLILYVCMNCYLLQLSKVPAPPELYDEYHHLSSASKGNIKHLEDVAEFIQNILGNDLKILEIGANDMYLTNILKNKNKALAIDPAKNINSEDDNIIIDYFNLESSKKIKNNFGEFDLIIGLNVFAHNDSFQEMFFAAKNLMHNNSVLLVEVAYAVDTIGQGLFDTIYHEHVCSYSLYSLKKIFEIVGLEINFVEHLDTQGGSLRLLLGKQKRKFELNNQLEKITEEEVKIGINSLEFYESITSKVKSKIQSLNSFIEKINNKNEGLLIIGAPARGVVTLNSINKINTSVVIVDDTILKQDKLMPGVHHPISNWDIDLNNYSDCIILSWNYAEYLKQKLQEKDRTRREEELKFKM